jgi:hypothetical protein
MDISQIQKLTPEQRDELKKKLVLRPLESPEELRAWMYLFLGILFPMGVVYPTSTHGPVDAMWRIYQLMRTGESEECPQVCMLSSRDSYKTLGAAALEVLCMLHFRLPVAHMAAIKTQSAKAIQYVNAFFRGLRPYLEHHSWKKTSDSKTYIEWITDRDETVYLNIITATIAGANSEHVPMLFIDEVDVVQDPRALKEAKMIPSVYKGYFPLTVYLSTRKFAGGLMEKTLKETLEAHGEILRWNILDVTARIPIEEARVDEPKIPRYVSVQLPMENLSEEEFQEVIDENKPYYERVEAYAGIATHPLFPVMRNYLVDRPQDDHGYLYKPVSAVRNNFRQLPADMGEAQLLCNKPSSSGLVYPRFDEDKNVISVAEAIEKITGEKSNINNFEYLKDLVVNLGVPIVGGGDWGFSDYTALGIFVILPGGVVLHMDTLAEQSLELDDIVKYATEFQREWNVDKWYVDQNYPAYIKTLKRKGLKVPKFKKVVEDGIAALQGRVVNAENVRKYYIIDTPNNKQVIDAFGEYRWKLDGKGEIVEGVPHHDKDGVSDIMDMIRYPHQNLFSKNSKVTFGVTGEKDSAIKTAVSNAENREAAVKQVNKAIMKDKISSLATNNGNITQVKKKGRIFWG